MIRIEVSTNADRVERAMRALFRDQMPFATSLAINNTAKDAQRAQRARMADVFTIRRPTFFNRAVKIKPFATKKSLEAVIQIEPPGGKERADIITRHEVRHRRTPIEGRALAVPIEARPSKQQVVPKKDRPKRLDFRKVATRSGTELFKGRGGTFMIRRRDGTGVILRRKGQTGVDVLYALKESVPIEPRLKFIETVVRTVRDRFQVNMRKAFARATGGAG